MNIEVLVSTMNRVDYSLIEKMRIKTDAVVVNQCQVDSVDVLIINGKRIKWINSTTKGLSVSRNICLSEASGDICLIADDDLEYVDNYAEIVATAFDNNKKAAIIRFKVQGIEKKFKDYPEREASIGYLKSLRVSSVEIALRKGKIKDISFNELIGAGTKFCMGEENVFLINCIKKGLKIYYVPQVISHLHIINSSWKNITDERYFVSRGAIFEAMELGFVHLFILQFAIRKRKIFDKSLSIYQRIKLMEVGRREYIEEKYLNSK